jgi:hypothetical protein
MKKTTRRRSNPRLQLQIARAQLRAIRQYAAPDVALQAKPGLPQFVQCWSVNRGYSSVTQGLDSAGQVWERVSLMEETLVEGKKVKSVKESWWVRVPMTRKEEA